MINNQNHQICFKDQIKSRSKSLNTYQKREKQIQKQNLQRNERWKYDKQISSKNIKYTRNAGLSEIKPSILENRENIMHNTTIGQEKLKKLNQLKNHRSQNNLSLFSSELRVFEGAKPNQNQKVINFQFSNLTLIKTDIKQASVTQDYLMYIDQEEKAIFVQSGQNTKIAKKQYVKQFCQMNKTNIKTIFCTPFCTFVITYKQQFYGFGLNDRGQLGIRNLGMINVPQRIRLNKQNKNKDFCNVIQNCLQFPLKISGGPFHTVMLTKRGNIYYTGIFYDQKSLCQNYFHEQFSRLDMKGNCIKDIECGLTSTVFLTSKQNILIMGLFGQNNFYQTPIDIQMPQKNNIKKISIQNDIIYAIYQNGKLFKINMNKRIPNIVQIKFEDKYTNLNKNLSSLHVVNMYSNGNRIIFAVEVTQNRKKQQSMTIKYFTKYQLNSEKQQNQFYQIKIDSNWNKLVPHNIYFVNNRLYFIFSQKQLQKQQIQTAKCKQTQHQKDKLTNLSIQCYVEQIKKLEQQNNRLKLQQIQNSKKQSRKTQKSQKNKKTDQQNLSPSENSNLKFNFTQHDGQINPRTFTHDLQIEFNQIKLNKKIAEGGYGVIYKAQWKKTQVAVKIFKIDQTSQNQIKQFISECRAMQALRHPNIVMFLGVCLKPPNFAIVLQYCEGGTLWSLLQNHKNQISWKEKFTIALQIARAMNYLHDRKNPIVHRDLKSLNILFDVNRKVKLADFGWTKRLENYMTSKIGTYQWMAPQVLTGQLYTQKADIFSFSIILWQIASRQPPYRNMNGLQVAYDVANKQYRPQIPKDTPVKFEQLMIECWKKDAIKRPSFKQIIQRLQQLLKDQK